MAHDHSHNHAHGHDHSHLTEKRLGQAFFLIAGFMLVEAIGGVLTNSLTLLADAGHMFLDATALGLAWYAVRLSRRDGDDTLSYGYHRYQVLAAFVNALTLIALVVWIVIEALQRLNSPEGMVPIPALIIASIGFVVNLVAFRMLHGSEDNANVRAAVLHVLGDLLGSAAAIIAAAAVYFGGWTYADPILALVIAVILMRGAISVLKDSANILLEGVPDGVDLESIRAKLTAAVPGVTGIHHVHAWGLTAERPLVTLHADVTEGHDIALVTAQLKSVLSKDFGIDHSTIQVEQGVCLDHTDDAHEGHGHD